MPTAVLVLTFEVALSPLPESPNGKPILLSATYVISTAKLSVHYDRPLIHLTQSPSNWALRHFSQALIPFNMAIVGSNVVADIFLGGFAPPGSLITYYATPPQVWAIGGSPADPFVNYPLTVVP